MGIFVWILFIIVYVMVIRAKASGNTRTNSGHRPNTSGNRPPARSQQRSFAAMPKQENAVPNVERDCTADDKHRFENNLSRFNKKKPTAIPNVQSSSMRLQPKKSGNRKIARQLYMGDVVPQGMRVVECSYCAADNLVPYTARNEYKCYFCHYDI